MNKISQKNKRQFNRHFVDFLRNNFLNSEIKKAPKNSSLEQNKESAPSTKKPEHSPTMPLVDALHQIPDNRNEYNFEIEEKIASEWRSSHIKEKTDFPDNKNKVKKKQANNRLLADLIRKTTGPKYETVRYFGKIAEFKLPMKFAYTMLVIMSVSALITFQGPSFGVVSFFDKIFLSPFKVLAGSPEFEPLNPISQEKKSEYIINNSQYLQELRRNNINSIKVKTENLNGKVAGVSEIKSMENENGFSIFLKKLKSLIK